MIVTVTPNPSIDRTVTLSTQLLRGAVLRAQRVSVEPGGKGVNVAHALTLAAVEAVAVLPAAPQDPIVAALQACGVPFRTVPIVGAIRTNLTITEPDGTTTKINEAGAALNSSSLAALTAAVIDRAATASWVVLSGSLPPGVPDDWYAEIVSLLRPYPCKVAVDTSGAPLVALAANFNDAAPDLIKPNSEELATLANVPVEELETALAQGNSELIFKLSQHLVGRGVGAVLATLGAAGALLVDTSGAWMATPPPMKPVSTVGAGDSSLAGYVRAEVAGYAPPQRLQMAVAYGSAAAALPGSALPTPQQIDPDAVMVTAVPTETSEVHS